VLETGGFQDVETANRASGQRLAAAGVEVRYDPSSVITHAKVVLVDDAVVVYSGNWVYSGLRQNHEAGAITRKPAPVAEAVDWFTGIWNSSTP